MYRTPCSYIRDSDRGTAERMSPSAAVRNSDDVLKHADQPYRRRFVILLSLTFSAAIFGLTRGSGPRHRGEVIDAKTHSGRRESSTPNRQWVVGGRGFYPLLALQSESQERKVRIYHVGRDGASHADGRDRALIEARGRKAGADRPEFSTGSTGTAAAERPWPPTHHYSRRAAVANDGPAASPRYLKDCRQRVKSGHRAWSSAQAWRSLRDAGDDADRHLLRGQYGRPRGSIAVGSG